MKKIQKKGVQVRRQGQKAKGGANRMLHTHKVKEGSGWEQKHLGTTDMTERGKGGSVISHLLGGCLMNGGGFLGRFGWKRAIV